MNTPRLTLLMFVASQSVLMKVSCEWGHDEVDVSFPLLYFTDFFANLNILSGNNI